FSPDRRAAIGYRVRFGVALAGGDPVGDASAGPAAIAAFITLCEQHGWRPAVLGAGEDLLPVWQRYGLHGVTIGDEAVIDVAGFHLSSRGMRNVRQAVNRSRNAGVTVTLGPLDQALAGALRPVLDDWLHGHRERGFAMNLDRILTPRADCLIAVAYGPDGRPEAFARFAVCGDGQILTLDVAPRRADAPNGVVERLVVEVVEYARRRGMREVSLNFAGLRRMFEASGPIARAAAPLRHAFDHWIQLGPLYRFCAKFHPRWRARYLLLRSWFAVAPVAAAALTAEFGGTPAAAAPEPERLPGGEPTAGSVPC
ncbi:MAG TPA: phosphatidylglycerol lysyltransferase domain-containing protein, partial [Rugosimonospora sp.]|nr:phosphatidylglycerol lysyltransferase domain-containing protein [Rugosimonospora sp.]